MAAVGYALEHFYYGQVVRGGKPEGELRLLCTSPGVTQEQVAEAVRTAIIPPLAAAPLGAWALVRGKTIPFILVQSQIGEASAAMLHFIFIPVDVLRGLGGNIQAMMTLLQERMAAVEAPVASTEPLVMPQVVPASNDTQVDAMLALMGYARNKLDTVETLLAAIVQGVQLVVLNAPPDAQKRALFVEGLLALLPPPARFGVTFAMHSMQSTRVDAQIRFLASANVPDGAMVYDWNTGQISGTPAEDHYSHYIVSQLRLDTSMVLEQTNALTAVAAWRIRRGDTLAESLSYASHRLKMDNSLLNNLPVEAEEASRVLAEDPTLTESLRNTYARHVLMFALALEDMSAAEPIAIMLREQPALEKAVLQQMSDALQEGRAKIVYDALSRWMSKPLGPTSSDWVALAQAAALVHLKSLVTAGEPAAVRAFLHELHQASRALELGSVISRMVETAMPLMERDKDLADTLFVLGAEYSTVDVFQQMLTNRALLSRLPETLSRLSPFLTGDEAGPGPAGLLARAAASFGEEWEPLMTIRLAETALNAKRSDLIDTPMLSSLVRAAGSPHAVHYDNLFRLVVRTLSTDEFLPALDDPGPRYLLQILLTRRAYPEMAHELLRHARVLYPTDKQGEYAIMVRRLFAETPITASEVSDALRLLNAGGVKPLPLAMAHLGALKQCGWPDSMQPVAVNVTGVLFGNQTIVDAIPPASLLELLDFHVKHHDIANSIRVAGLLPTLAAQKGEGGAALMIQMFKMMTWEKQPRQAAVEVLRRYVRLVDDQFVRQAVNRLAEALGEKVRQALDATLLMRNVLGDEDMSGYAMLIRLTAQFLHDTTMAYVDKRGMPGHKTLLGDLDSLFGGLSDDDRRKLAGTIVELGRLVVINGRQQQNRPRDMEGHIRPLLEGKGSPQTPLDVLWVMAGYFARGKRVPVKFVAPTTAHPLGDRAAPSLLWETQLITKMLRNLAKAFPADTKVIYTAEAIRAEIESLWGDVSLLERRKLVRDLAVDLQQLPELILYIHDHGDTKVLEESNGNGKRLDSNKRRPENTLEFYRFVHGYFKSRIREK